MKYKRVLISPELLLQLFTPGPHPAGYTVVAEAIPEDAKVINVCHGWPSRIELLISSETFERLSPGDEIPALTPHITRHEPAPGTWPNK